MKLIWSIVALLGLGFSAQAEPAANRAFQVGETLKYNILWGPVVAGKASLQVIGIEPIDGHDCYHVRARARTAGLVRLLYPVSSTVDAWLDVDGLFTRRHEQNRAEGAHRTHETGTYDYSQSTITVTNHLTGKVKTSALTEPVREVISSVYFLRTQPLALNVPHQIALQESATNYVVTVKPDERRKIDVRPLGPVDALRIEPHPTLRIVDSLKGRVWVWLSDDARRLPLLVVCSMPIGSARLVLERADDKIAPAPEEVGAAPVPATTDNLATVAP
jgi:hypothetical protein